MKMHMVQDAKILMLAYYYPPLNTVSVLRNFQVSKEFVQHFARTYVISSTNRKRFEVGDFEFPDIEIFDAVTFDYKTVLSFHKNKSVNIAHTEKNNPLSALFVKLSRSVPFSFIIGEGGFFYILHSFFIAQKLIRYNKIKYIYTSFGPISDHFTAYILKFFFPNLIWIADYRDLPVSSILDNVLFRNFQHRFHKFVLKKAQLVTTVSTGLAARINEYIAGTPEKKCFILRNGIDAEILNFKRQPFEKFTFAYTGSMYGYEHVDIFMETIYGLIQKNKINRSDIRIIYAGKDQTLWQNEANKFGLKDIFIPKGIVSRAASYDIQRNAHINLVFSATEKGNDGIMTTKFYEYLAASNPVAVIINGKNKDEEFENIMSDFNAGIVTYTAEARTELPEFILKNYTDWKIFGDIKRPDNSEKIKTFIWKNMANNFVQKIFDIS